MIDSTHKLPLKRQAELLALSRSNVYYLPRGRCQASCRINRYSILGDVLMLRPQSVWPPWAADSTTHDRGRAVVA